jgi:hypothetical protein
MPKPAKHKIIKSGLKVEVFTPDIPFMIGLSDKIDTTENMSNDDLAYALDCEPEDIYQEMGLVDKLKAYQKDLQAKINSKQLTFDEIGKYTERQRKEEYRLRTLYRARNKVRRLIQANFKNGDKFITLTFSPKRCEGKFDITDPRETNKEFYKFIRAIRKDYPDMKYLAVMEFQKDTDYYGNKKKKGGAVHYHLLTNLPYIEWTEYEKYWPHAKSPYIEVIKQQERIGVYLTKYLSKEMFIKKYDKMRKFFYSRNMECEKMGYSNQITHLEYLARCYPKLVRVFTKTYKSIYNGNITYQEYDFTKYYQERLRYKEKISAHIPSKQESVTL